MTPLNINSARESLAECLTGKEFRYQTASGGEVFGTVKEVGIEHMMAFDPQTEASISRFMGSMGHTPPPPADTALQTATGSKWAGIKFRMFIISETGNRYALEDVHFLTKHEPK